MNSAYTDIAYLRRYINGELSSAEMYDLERAAHEDEMIMDMLLGLEFEKSNQLPATIEDIKQRILQRAKQTVIVPIKQNRPGFLEWGAAASVFAILGFVGYLLWQSPRMENQEKLAQSVQEESSNLSVESKQDSISQLEDPTASVENVTAYVAPDKTKIAKKSVLTKDQSRKTNKIAALPQNLPRINSVSPGALTQHQTDMADLTLEEVIIIDRPQRLATTVPQIQIIENKNTLRKVNDHSVFHNTNPEMQRARLQQMNLDPQAMAVLNQAIESQKREAQIAGKDIQKQEVDFDADKLSYISAVKALREPTEKTGDTEAVVNAKMLQQAPRRPSHPVIGWKGFDDYLKKNMGKKTKGKVLVVVDFSIDDKGRPDHIVVNSADVSLQKRITKLLLDGPQWIRSEDSNAVRLEMKF